MKQKLLRVLLALSMTVPLFAQSTNHEFKSATKQVSNDIFSEVTDDVLNVTGFSTVEGNVIGAQLGNNAANVLVDVLWGKKFNGFFIGAGYNGNFFSQASRKDIIVINNNSFDGNGNLLGSATETGKDEKNSSANQGYENNVAVLFGLKNMGFKLRFDSNVDKTAKKGALNGQDLTLDGTTFTWLEYAQDIQTSGDQITGAINKTVFDKKGFYNGGTGAGNNGLVFKPHVDFGINLGLGMNLWVTAHTGADIAHKNYYYGYLTETRLVSSQTSDTRQEKFYQHLTNFDYKVGAEAGATFGILSPSLAYDFAVNTDLGKKFDVDKKTAFTKYESSDEYVFATGTRTKTDVYTGGTERATLFTNEVVPALLIMPDFGERVLFGIKVKVPVTIKSSTTKTPGVDSIEITSYTYDSPGNGPVMPVSRKITTEHGVEESATQTVFAPEVLMGLAYEAVPGKFRLNFGLKLTLPKYVYDVNETKIKNGTKTTVTDYTNGTQTTETDVFLDGSTSGSTDKTEGRYASGVWSFAELSKLANVRLGATWFVNEKLTFDFDINILGWSTSLFENPFNETSGANLSLTATYRY